MCEPHQRVATIVASNEHVNECMNDHGCTRRKEQCHGAGDEQPLLGLGLERAVTTIEAYTTRQHGRRQDS